jgi:hypothetical protein
LGSQVGGLSSRFPKKQIKEFLHLQGAFHRNLDLLGSLAGNGSLLKGSLKVPARFYCCIWRYINITLNLSLLLGKFTSFFKK